MENYLRVSQSESVVEKCIKYFKTVSIENLEEPEAISAFKTMLYFIKTYKSETIVELEKKVREIIERLISINVSMSVISGCELFFRYITLSSIDNTDFSECQRLLVQRGEIFTNHCVNSINVIGQQGQTFIRNQYKILTHSKSRLVLEIFKCAVENHKVFEVFVPESRLDMSGREMYNMLLDHGIKATLILDSAVAYIMERVNAVFYGSECVVESGGVFSEIGSYQMAVLARNAKVPVYAVTETFKFIRCYPYKQIDVPNVAKYEKSNSELDSGHPTIDYTPPELIKFLITDLGVMTPIAVSDELIRLYF